MKPFSASGHSVPLGHMGDPDSGCCLGRGCIRGLAVRARCSHLVLYHQHQQPHSASSSLSLQLQPHSTLPVKEFISTSHLTQKTSSHESTKTSTKMSPIVARAAIRSAAQASARRQFSVLHNLRSFARSFEPHPFERLPVTTNSQAADWGRHVKRISQQVAIFVPGFALVLGWPALAKAVVNDHV
ncbi:hypothetical protein QBC34DRAFT_395221 [Podospora aff. communis PSN243]|uniref:Uncharacterized protein n=1 Tax=Podospora aff. communis PSN243 TaxID=3040156 RepID=A0AAV9H1P2_9PEZI|nr:hypothetical protein QBC34DRAFT_395221 [Podospora aff. communis PSN243]